MLTEEINECVDYAFKRGKELIVMWNDYSMQQIRLQSANLRRIEENRQKHIEEMDEKKRMRYKIIKQANYEKWKRHHPDHPEQEKNGN